MNYHNELCKKEILVYWNQKEVYLLPTMDKILFWTHS